MQLHSPAVITKNSRAGSGDKRSWPLSVGTNGPLPPDLTSYTNSSLRHRRRPLFWRDRGTHAYLFTLCVYLCGGKWVPDVGPVPLNKQDARYNISRRPAESAR
ncbi:Hypothetical protein NTJ_09038 [Nesidiocoris tenuis]|uniref:Uncharacterized protein n=1 Tax=Nesidiocoris tenuis TaxID=355587 RepID=A0ABN7AXH2_9HEMI|nr:Hypothetical protein NTJ_09038 [Nesidiocoris tenuis]